MAVVSSYRPRAGRRGAAGVSSSGFGGGTRRGKVGRVTQSGLGKSRPGMRPSKPGLGAAPSPMKPAVSKPKVIGASAQPDSAYFNRVDSAQRQQSSRLGELEGQETAIKREFGIEDPTDPFSRANALKQTYLARQKAASASLAAEGHLYSGQHERAVSRTRTDEEQARSELRHVYETALGGVASAKTGALNATEDEQNQAFEDWLSRAPDAEAPLAAEEAPPAAGPAPKSTPAAKVTAPSGRPIAAGPPVVAASGQQVTSGGMTADQSAKLKARGKALQGAVKKQGGGIGGGMTRGKVKAKLKAKPKAKARKRR